MKFKINQGTSIDPVEYKVSSGMGLSINPASHPVPIIPFII
jgi:hypothetical protein